MCEKGLYSYYTNKVFHVKNITVSPFSYFYYFVQFSFVNVSCIVVFKMIVVLCIIKHNYVNCHC